MSLFVHPNVMPLIGLCFDEEMPLLIMPFMSKGNVLEYVKQNKVDLHKDQEASEVEVLTLLVYVHKSKNKCSWPFPGGSDKPQEGPFLHSLVAVAVPQHRPAVLCV